ncbi:MAG: PEP-CTERM sorting domain-containing protein [Spirulina sp. SIO3F2]|nr:PEP-CTERM sorting domain-containing protein [Spirulina sp. SIO3F2]
MMRENNLLASTVLLIASSLTIGSFGKGEPAKAAVITFDDAIRGASEYQFDGDGDGINDVIFSTEDPLGFNTAGPGPNMSFVQEPGLEGTSLLNTDLRVDFLVGATDYLQFGFALNTGRESNDVFSNIEVYDKNSQLLTSVTELAKFTSPNGSGRSSFPEGLLKATFQGTAAYAKLNFNSDSSRYIIDNFEGNFGSTEVPEPLATLALLGIGVVGLNLRRRKQ